MGAFFDLILPYGGMLWQGAIVTMALTAAFILAGSLGALLLTGLRYLPGTCGVGRLLVQAYVAYHRNVPMVVQLLFWYFGAPELLPGALVQTVYAWGASEFVFSAVALSCCFAAYVAEDLRSGIQSVPPRQREAARTLGLSFFSQQVFIVLPQALRTAWPAIASQTILFFKATSLAAAIGVADLASVGQHINNNSFRTFEAFTMITLTYVVMSWGLAAAFMAVERALRKAVPS